MKTSTRRFRVISAGAALLAAASAGIVGAQAASATTVCNSAYQTVTVYNEASNDLGVAALSVYDWGNPADLTQIGKVYYGTSRTFCLYPNRTVIVDANSSYGWEAATSFHTYANSTLRFILYPNPDGVYGYNSADRDWQFIKR